MEKGEAAVMRVYYDPQAFMRQRIGGISRLFTDLMASFDIDPTLEVQPQISFRWSNNRHATEMLPERGLHSTPSWLPRGVAYAPWWLIPGRGAGPADLVHHTYYSSRFLGALPGVPKVTTVYDMIPELFAGTGFHTGSHLQKRRYVRECDLIICISESTRMDLEGLLGTPPGEVRVIPLGVAPGFSPELPPMTGLPPEYLLYVGARRGYKDFALLPEALRALRDRGLDVPVVVVGKELTDNERALIDRHRLGDLVQQVSLADQGLKRAYAHCAALVQTSSYEGFGLTPLEAMASGAPVVVARASSMPEVCGEAAAYFEPGDAGSLADALAMVLTDTDRNREMRRLGLERAAYFTTRRTAELTAQAYRELLSA